MYFIISLLHFFAEVQCKNETKQWKHLEREGRPVFIYLFSRLVCSQYGCRLHRPGNHLPYPIFFIADKPRPFSYSTGLMGDNTWTKFHWQSGFDQYACLNENICYFFIAKFIVKF